MLSTTGGGARVIRCAAFLSKTKQLKQRAEKLEDAAKPAHLERSAGAIRLASRGTHAKVLVTLDDATVETPDGRLLFRTGKQFIGKGDRIVLLGPNGAGKTRLVAMLRTAIENPDAAPAGIKATQSLKLGYCDQTLAVLADADTPMRTIVRRFDVGDQSARTLLAAAINRRRTVVANIPRYGPLATRRAYGVRGYYRLGPGEALRSENFLAADPRGGSHQNPRFADQVGKIDFAPAGPFRVSRRRNNRWIVVKHFHLQVIRSLIVRPYFY
jgi:energy-coupling factor transporter ATP-binding protein EcfA2